MKKITFGMMLTLFASTLFFSSCGEDDLILEGVITMPAEYSLNVNENSPNGTSIVDFSNTVSTTEGTITYSIVSQTPSSTLSIQGSELLVANSSELDYESNTEITGLIEASIGDVKKTANFTVTINNLEDDISDLLSTSLSAYTTQANNQWLEVTEAEYNLLATKLNDITVGGLKDDNFLNTTSFTSNYTQSAVTSTDNLITVDTIPAQSYIIGFKFISRATANSGVKLKASTSSPKTGFSNVADDIDISNSSAGKVHYFVNKSTEIIASKAFSAIYTGSADIGGLSTNKANRFYYNGDATSATTLAGPITGNMPGYQTLSTTIKQW